MKEPRAILEPPRRDEASNAAESAFARELERQRHALAALLRQVVARADLRGDALQETLARAWRFRGQYDAGRPLGPWLATIARRVARELERRRRRRKDGGEWSDALAASLAEEGAAGRDPLALLAGREEKARLDTEIERLREPARGIVARFYRDGATVDAIARELAMPANTVKSHLRRARRTLARRLGGWGAAIVVAALTAWWALAPEEATTTQGDALQVAAPRERTRRMELVECTTDYGESGPGGSRRVTTELLPGWPARRLVVETSVGADGIVMRYERTELLPAADEERGP